MIDYRIFTVGEVTAYLQAKLAEDEVLNDLWVSGEISNFYRHNSGHMYFTIKDDRSQLKSIMFHSKNKNMKFEPEDGMKVTAHGYLDIYMPRGEYQFYIDQMEPEGKGALYLAYEQLKNRLEKEGLFDSELKKTIPVLPERIGVITSPTGAAIRDILSVVNRRFGNISVLIFPSLVQGDKASGQIVEGLEFFNREKNVDLIIVSRGGGSIEDLWPFNEEEVARSIYNSVIPVISGVGHETDYTISDFVADLRAPTPSAAAELAISNRLELEKELDNYSVRLNNYIQNLVSNYKDRLSTIAGKRIFTVPEELFSNQLQLLDELNRRLEWSMEKQLNSKKENFKIMGSKLDTLSPLKTLERGYSISQVDEKVITDKNMVDVGDLMVTRILNGRIISRIKDIKEAGDTDGR